MTILPLVKVKVKVNSQSTQLVELSPKSTSAWIAQTHGQLSQLSESLYRLVEFNLSYHRRISTLLIESLHGLIEFFTF